MLKISVKTLLNHGKLMRSILYVRGTEYEILDAKCLTIEAAFKDFKKGRISKDFTDMLWGPDAAKDLLNDLQNNAEGYFLGPKIHLIAVGSRGNY